MNKKYIYIIGAVIGAFLLGTLISNQSQKKSIDDIPVPEINVPRVEYTRPTDLPAPEVTNYRIGETITKGNVSFTVHSVRVESTSGYSTKPGYVFVIVKATVENNGNTPLKFGSFDSGLTVKDIEGTQYATAIGPSLEGRLTNNVLPHEKNKGEIAFQVSKGAKGLTMYAQEQWTQGDVIKIALGELDLNK